MIKRVMMGLKCFNTVENKRLDLFSWDVLESPVFGPELYTPFKNRTAGFSEGCIKFLSQNKPFFSDFLTWEFFLNFILLNQFYIFESDFLTEIPFGFHFILLLRSQLKLSPGGHFIWLQSLCNRLENRRFLPWRRVGSGETFFHKVKSFTTNLWDKEVATNLYVCVDFSGFYEIRNPWKRSHHYQQLFSHFWLSKLNFWKKYWKEIVKLCVRFS